jgi:hypothetical protein
MSTFPADRPDGPSQYEIRVEGHLESRWAAWFDGMTLLSADDGSTVLTGTALDQAALHGVLRKVRDLGLPLLAVTRIDPDQPHTSAPAR